VSTLQHRIRGGAIRLVFLLSILSLTVVPISFSQTNDQPRSTPSVTSDQSVETPSESSEAAFADVETWRGRSGNAREFGCALFFDSRLARR
jgi:hypothetical protein